jgi:hypothetical protein
MSDETTSHLEPLRFVIEESTATLERVLGSGLLSPQIALILNETSTISSAVARLATALDRHAPEAPSKPSKTCESIEYDYPSIKQEMAALGVFSEALRAGQVCPCCGGIAPPA